MDVTEAVVRAWAVVREMLADRGEALDACDGVGDVEVAALAAAGPTFGVAVNASLAAVFHGATQTVKKADVFAAAGAATRVLLVLNTQPYGAASTPASVAKPNIATVKSLEHEAAARGVALEIFTLRELQYNISRHAMVPRHVRLTAEEERALLRDLCLKAKTQLPSISKTDPVARYLGLAPGDVVRIERPSLTSGRSIAYRCCRRA
jgi:DNA-directed RNA polymerase subunit H (RpoH/RPB5)